MQTTRRAQSKVHAAVLVAVLAAIAFVAGACVPPKAAPPPTTTTTTTTPPGPSLFCKIWEQREKPDENGNVPPRPFIYELDADTIAHAREVSQVGTDCKDPIARIDLFQGEIVGRDMYLPPHNHNDGPARPVTAYSQTLAEGQPQAPSIVITSLNLSISASGIRIWGTLRVTINGVPSTVNYDGRYLNLQNFSVKLSAAALHLPGLASQPISVLGMFVRSHGLNEITFDANIPDLQVGDLFLEGVALHLHAATTTGLTASVKGKLSAAGNFIDVDIAAVFDERGVLADIDGRVDLAIASTTPQGDPISIDGHLQFSGESTNITASFSGSGRYKTDNYARVAGDVEIDASGIVTFHGLFDAAVGPNSLRLEGTVIFDGSHGTPTFTAMGAGHLSASTDRGEIVEIDGTFVITPGHTTISGSLRVGDLRGTASAEVLMSNGNLTTTLVLAGHIATGTFDAQVTGQLVFTSGVVQQVNLQGSLSHPADAGGVAVNGAVSIVGNRNGYAIDVNGSITGPGVNVTGVAHLALEGNGDFWSLSANVRGTVAQAGWMIPNFSGSITAGPGGAVLRGAGILIGAGVLYGAVHGELTVSGGTSSLNAAGQAAVLSGTKVVYGDFSIASNELQMLRVGVVYPYWLPLIPGPERVWVRLQLGAAGNCTHVTILEATFLIGLFTGGVAAAQDLACPAP